MKTLDLPRFALALRLRRALQDLPLRDAAEEAGVSASTLSRLERGQVPDLLTYVRLCDWMGVGLEFFLQEEEKEATSED